MSAVISIESDSPQPLFDKTSRMCSYCMYFTVAQDLEHALVASHSLPPFDPSYSDLCLVLIPSTYSLVSSRHAENGSCIQSWLGLLLRAA